MLWGRSTPFDFVFLVASLRTKGLELSIMRALLRRLPCLAGLLALLVVSAAAQATDAPSATILPPDDGDGASAAAVLGHVDSGRLYYIVGMGGAVFLQLVGAVALCCYAVHGMPKKRVAMPVAH
jgi:hypothetical protein